MVGDGTTDVEAGHRAGVETIAVLWGYRSREELAPTEPDHFAESVAELTELLDI